MRRTRTVTSVLLLAAIGAFIVLALAGCGPDGGASKSDWCQIPNAHGCPTTSP
ncbi:hypothetical protein [Mycobacterium sp.]|uniref:hypothetical protein n=1 Tax=Mycobacterium sp. TaxID=1785 RepID=UPI002CEB91C3|nr:hypothetical protein [Mycobacterium sp.]HTY35399.1 hypothetical protein [Mycobacterium sp.]